MDDAEALIERSHLALAKFFEGDPAPVLHLFSRQEDVTLGNPFGPFVRGWEAVVESATRAAAHYSQGEVVGVDRVATYSAAHLACFVEIERYRARVGDSTEFSSIALRVSTVVRLEDDGWKVVSRHADPITMPRSPESVIQSD